MSRLPSRSPSPAGAPAWTRRSLLGAAVASLASVPAWAQESVRPVILVLTADETERTLTIVSTFKKGCDFAVRMSYLIGNEADAGAFIADNIRGQPIGLVFAVGVVATQVALREFAGTPVIYAEVSPEQAPTGSPNAVGVTAKLDPGPTLERFKVLLPGLQQVGALFNNSTDSYADAVRAACGALGLKLTTRQVGTADEVSNAFVAVSGASQLVWLPHASRIWSGGSLARVFHEANIQRFPVVSFLRSHLDAPDPPALVAYAHPVGVGEVAAGLARATILKEPAPVIVGVPPMIAGHARAMRAAGMVVSAKSTTALDELVGR